MQPVHPLLLDDQASCAALLFPPVPSTTALCPRLGGRLAHQQRPVQRGNRAQDCQHRWLLERGCCAHVHARCARECGGILAHSYADGGQWSNYVAAAARGCSLQALLQAAPALNLGPAALPPAQRRAL